MINHHTHLYYWIFLISISVVLCFFLINQSIIYVIIAFLYLILGENINYAGVNYNESKRLFEESLMKDMRKVK